MGAQALKDEGAASLAAGIATNKGLIELNLMGLGGTIAIKSEGICASFVKAFETNVTLKKVFTAAVPAYFLFVICLFSRFASLWCLPRIPECPQASRIGLTPSHRSALLSLERW